MIEIKLPVHGFLCQNCFGKNDVKELVFYTGGTGVIVRLCADCMRELTQKIGDVFAEEKLKKHAGKPAQINYLPVCSECGEIITDDVKIIRTNRAGDGDYEISPEVCPKCGAVFNGITELFPTLVQHEAR